MVIAAAVDIPTPIMRLTVIVNTTRPTMVGIRRSSRAPSPTPPSRERTVGRGPAGASTRSSLRSEHVFRAVNTNSPPMTSSRSVVSRKAARTAASAGPSTALPCSVAWMVAWARTIWLSGTNRGRLVSIARYACAPASDIPAASTASVPNRPDVHVKTRTNAANARVARTASASR